VEELRSQGQNKSRVSALVVLQSYDVDRDEI
jgi:hypothetical protein